MPMRRSQAGSLRSSASQKVMKTIAPNGVRNANSIVPTPTKQKKRRKPSAIRSCSGTNAGFSGSGSSFGCSGSVAGSSSMGTV